MNDGFRHELRLDLPAAHRGVRVARNIVLRFARLQGAPREAMDSLSLVASELLANVIDHGGGEAAMTEGELDGDVRMRLELVVGTGAWTLTVTDEGGGRPEDMQARIAAAASFEEEDDRGRGLFLMRAMVDELEVLPSEGGRGLCFRAVKRYA